MGLGTLRSSTHGGSVQERSSLFAVGARGGQNEERSHTVSELWYMYIFTEQGPTEGEHKASLIDHPGTDPHDRKPCVFFETHLPAVSLLVASSPCGQPVCAAEVCEVPYSPWATSQPQPG